MLEEEKRPKRQISWTNPAYRTTLWQHWGRRSKSPSHNFCSGGGVGIFLFKLSNKTWKIFHLFSPRQRYLWNIYNAFCKNVLGENPQRETLLRRFNKIDPESALRKSFVLAAEILWTSKTFDWYFSSATWLLRKIIRVQLQMHLKA